MKKSLFQKFISILLSLTFLVSFSIPAYAATDPSQVPSGEFYKIPDLDHIVEKGLLIDGYDVVAVKKGNEMVIWTQNYLTQPQKETLWKNINSPNGLGVGNPTLSYFYGKGDFPATNPKYSISKVGVNYYLYVTGEDKVSLFIVHKGTKPEQITATKVVSGESAPAQNFTFILKEGATQVGTATRTGAGDVTFDLDSSYTRPWGGATLTMTEVAPDLVPTGWDYSKESYTVSIDGVTGAVLYQDSNGKSVGTATFTNTYTAPKPVSFTIKANKVISGDTPAEMPDFSFALKDAENQTVGTATRSGAGAVTFTMNADYVLPATGATLTMTEVAPNPVPNGWDYSKESYTVSIDGVTGAVLYQDSNGKSVGTATFTNTYTAPKPVSFTIKANKVISGDTPAEMPDFSFALKDAENQTVGTATRSGAGAVTFTMNEGYKLPTGGAALTMTEDSTAAPAGWTYSTESYLVSINGSIGTVSYMDSGENPVEVPTFTNTYTAPKPVSFTITANKVVSGDTPAEMPDFTFTLKDAENQTVGTATRNGSGAVTFTMNADYVLPATGATLTMAEDIPTPQPANWDYSKASYTVSIDGVTGAVLYKDSNGKSAGTATFTNTYRAPKPVSFTIKANKVISGDTPAEMPDFSFTLKDAGNQTVGTATRSGAGAVTFAMNEGYKLPEGGATLTMTEDIPTPQPANWDYSKASYTVNISAAGIVAYKDNATNEAVETPAFTNTYTAPKPVNFTITANKVVSGDRPAEMPDFSFTLKNANNQTVGTATRNGAGAVTFTMNEGYKLPEGGATLTMTENSTNAPAGWTYSTESYLVSINGSTGAVSYMDSSEKPVEVPTFTNTYTAPKLISFTIKANKVVSGDRPTNMPNFTFTLKDADNQTVGTATRNGAGAVTFTMNEGYKLPEGGAMLTMTEDSTAAPAGWTYSKASYTVNISAAGVVTYKDNATNEAVGTPAFTNVYATEIIPEDPTPQSPPETPQTPPKTPEKPANNSPEVISDEPTPLVSPQTGESGHWSDYAGIALLASLAGGLVALVGIRKFRKARK